MEPLKGCALNALSLNTDKKCQGFITIYQSLVVLSALGTEYSNDLL